MQQAFVDEDDKSVGAVTDVGGDGYCRKDNDDDEDDEDGNTNDNDTGIGKVRIKRIMKGILK